MKAILTIILVIAVGLISGFYLVARTWCGWTASDMGLTHKHTIVSGCLVKDADSSVWVAPNRYRGIE